MRKAIVAAAVLVLGVVAGGATTALAAVNPNQPKILLHAKGVTTKNACSPVTTTCAGVDATADLYPALYHVHLLVAKGDSMQDIAGLQLGLQYDGSSNGATDGIGIDIFGWTLCATLEFQQPAGGGANAWPNPTSGNLITWDALVRCQNTEITSAGYFYMGAYGPDELRIIKRPADNAAKVADCSSAEAPPLTENALGFLAFSAGEAVAGCNPCLVDCAPVPVQKTTWSGIKTLLK
jgi:hypothetical protein